MNLILLPRSHGDIEGGAWLAHIEQLGDPDDVNRGRLGGGPDLSATLWTVVRARTWPTRESGLLAAYETLAAMHNALEITDPVSIEVEQLWNRPFEVAWGDFPGLLRAQIQDPAVLTIAERWPTGPVDQLREMLWPPRNRHVLLRLFDET